MALDSTIALSLFYTAVSADLKARVPLADITFGWRTPIRQSQAAAHIEFVPGDLSGKAGEDLPPRYIGKSEHRNLADLNEFFTVYVHGHDPSAPADELKQYAITRSLYHIWRAGMYRSAPGLVTVETLDWLIEKNEFRLGATLIAGCALRCPTPDDLAASIDLTAVQLSTILAHTNGPASPLEILP